MQGTERSKSASATGAMRDLRWVFSTSAQPLLQFQSDPDPIIFKYYFAQADVSETVRRSRCALIALAVLLRSMLCATLHKTSTAFHFTALR